MIDIRKLERLNVDSINWQQTDHKYNFEYRGKLVVDRYGACYFSEDGTIGQTVVSSVLDYRSGSEAVIFDHKEFLNLVLGGAQPQGNRTASAVTPLDVDLLIKLKQGGYTADELTNLREAGIV